MCVHYVCIFSDYWNCQGFISKITLFSRNKIEYFITLSFCLFVIKNICKVKTINLKFKVKIDKIKSKANKPFKVNIYIGYN